MILSDFLSINKTKQQLVGFNYCKKLFHNIVVLAFKVKAVMYPGIFWRYFFLRLVMPESSLPFPHCREWGDGKYFYSIWPTLLEDAFHRPDSHNILEKNRSGSLRNLLLLIICSFNLKEVLINFKMQARGRCSRFLNPKHVSFITMLEKFKSLLLSDLSMHITVIIKNWFYCYWGVLCRRKLTFMFLAFHQ